MDTIRLVAGDQLPALTFELKDSATGLPGKQTTWTPINLTGGSVAGKLISGSTVLATLTATITNAAAGQGYFEWGSSLVGLSGSYELEIVVTDVLGKVMTIHERVPLVVRAHA